MDTREQVLGKLIQRVAVVFQKSETELSEATHFVNDLRAKSANVVQITTALEDAFDVEIPFMEFKRKLTIGSAADYVTALVEG